MNTFPTLSRGPGASGYSVTTSSEAIQTANKSSGLPVKNKLFTFDPLEFKFTLFLVSDTDKNSVMDFYEENKDVPFYWLNTQNNTTYEVVFEGPIQYNMDRIKTRWQIMISLLQYSSVTS